MRRVRTGLAAAGALAWCPAGHAETLRIEGVFAAGAREASLLPTIGVDAIDGPQGGELGDAIERRLAQLGEDGVPHAQLVAPSLRPDGVLTGRTDVAVQDERYLETRRRCVEKDKDGKCIRRETYSVRCLRRTVKLRADLRMTIARDRRVAYAATKARDDDDSGCEDGGFVGSADASLRSMVESIANEVRLDLAPHRERYTIRVREERAGLSPVDADRFRAAVRLTKHDQAAACRAFAAIGDSASDHGPTLFNRALCAEQAGRYAEAGDLYLRARAFAPGFGGDISKGRERIDSLQAGTEDVRRMTGAAAASGPAIRINGGPSSSAGSMPGTSPLPRSARSAWSVQTDRP